MKHTKFASLARLPNHQSIDRPIRALIGSWRDMAPVEGDGHTDRTASAGGAPTIPEEEISRKNRQNLLDIKA